MKNILLKAIYQITPKPVDYVTIGRNMFDNAWPWYQEMHRLSVNSFKKNLLGDWELVELTGNIIGLQEAFKNTMLQTKKLWHKYYPCNILFTDCDTLCLRPLEIFGRFAEFRLFSSEPLNFNGYSNCGVRYFPSTIDKSFWEYMDSLMLTWADGQYDVEQDLYNELMWSQESMKQNLKQEQDNIVLNEKLTTVDEFRHYYGGKHKILHFLSSSNPRITVKLMTSEPVITATQT
jgi:hypothetical protein